MQPSKVTSRVRLGISLTSAEELALLDEYGVKALEVGYEFSGPALLDRQQRDDLLALLEKTRPPIYSLHAPYRPYRDISLLNEKRREAAVAYAVDALALAHDIGAGIVVIHGSEDPIIPSQRAERRAQARKSLVSLAETARQLKLRLALEMTPPEWLPAGIDEAFEIVDGIDTTVLGFCLDTNHANLTGDLPDIVGALGTRIWNIHLSDNDGIKQRHWLPFRGVIDWKAFMEALLRADYQGPLMYELDPHPDGVRQGLQEIKDTFERLIALAPAA